MPNPTGINSFGGPFEREQPYGAIQKQKSMTDLAPVNQPKSLNEPKNSQRRAVRGERRAAAAAPLPPAPQPEVPRIPPENEAALFWRALAAEPGASPLIQAYAREA